MKNRLGIFLTGLLVLLTLAFFLVILPSINPTTAKSSISPKDEEAIQEVLQQSLILEIEAYTTLDPSILENVYTNEPELCPIAKDGLTLVQVVYQDLSIQKDQIGTLDVRQANILWWKQHNEKVQAIERQMLAESRTTMTEEEKASLYDETGRNFFPLPGQQAYPSPFSDSKSSDIFIAPYVIESITVISDDQVKVLVFFEEFAGRNEYTFVKKGDVWLIACE